MLFIGNVNNIVIPIPNSPAIKPTINVSALNTLEISFLDAPIALNIPISFVLSSTDIYVIIPIIIGGLLGGDNLSTVISEFFIRWPRNFCAAFFLNILVAGPISRFVLRCVQSRTQTADESL